MLEGSFVWEVRFFFVILASVPVLVFYEPAGLIIAGLGTLAFFGLVRPVLKSHYYGRCIMSASCATCAGHKYRHLNHICLRVNFSPIGTGHDFFLRGDHALRPTHLQNLSFGGSWWCAFGGANQLGENKMADAPGGKSVLNFFDGIVHPLLAIYRAG